MTTENGSSPASAEKVTLSASTEQKIIRQIEYYFGDFNILRDKFMMEKIKEDDGWVTVETMTKFKRLAAMTTDHEAIIEALRKSSNDLMVISEDNKKIRRNPELPIPESMKAVFDKYEDRTVFVKGFGTDENLDNIQEYFDKVGVTVNIVMRRKPRGREFKGSVFVAFKEKEDCDKFLTSDEFKTYKGKELIRKLRTEYVKEKNETRQESKAKAAEARVDADEKRQEMNKARIRARMTLGALLELSGIPTDILESKVITRIKAMMQAAGTPAVSYIETFDLKNGKVVVRFKEENSAAQALSKLQEHKNGLKFTEPSADATEAKTEKEETAGEKDGDVEMEKGDSEEKPSHGENDTAKEESSEKKSNDDETDAGKDEEACQKSGEQDLVGRILVGEDEEKIWQHILDHRQQRTLKRRGPRRGRDGEPNQKRGRFGNKA